MCIFHENTLNCDQIVGKKCFYSLGRRQSAQLITRFDLMNVTTTFVTFLFSPSLSLSLFSFFFIMKEDKWQERTSCVSQVFNTPDNQTMTILQGIRIQLVELFYNHGTRIEYPNSIYDLFLQ